MKRLLPILLLLLTLTVGLTSTAVAQTGSGIFGNVGVHPGGHVGVYNTLTAVTGYVVTPRALPGSNISWQPGSSHNGASNGSHVNGYAETTGTTAFTFPIGTGTTLRTAGISAPTSGTFQAAYFLSNPSSGTLPTDAPFSTASLGSGVTGVSPVEYWDINGPSAVQLTLSWDPASNLNTLAGSTLSNLAIVGWDGSQWVNLGGTATGTLSGTGTITTTTAVIPANYTAYTFGSVSSCATPTVGGQISYGGNLPLCSQSNVGSLTLTGQTGAVTGWETSTDGGTNWAALPGTAGQTAYNFVNAQNNQQYRAIVNNQNAGPGSGCLSATATAVTLSTSNTACTAPALACDSRTGSLSITIANQTTGSNITAQVVAVDLGGIIRAFSAAGSNSLAGLPVGDYQVYHVTYDNTQTPLPAISIGTAVSAVGGSCVRWSNALAFRVCPPTVTITGPAPNTLVAITNPPITGTATPGTSVTVTGGPGTTGGPCIVTASSTGSFTCTSLTFTTGPQTITALACTGAGCASATTSFTVGAPPTLTVDPVPPTGPIPGTATPGIPLVITDPGGNTLCTTTASASGTFSCPVTLPPSVTSVIVTACNATSCVSQTAPVGPTLVVDPPRPGPVTQPVVGTATPGTIVTITGPGPVTLCSTVASISGSFSCLVTVPVGPTPVTVTACNTAGCATSVVTLTAIGPPTIAINPLPAISPLSPTVSGTATPGALVHILGPNSTTLCSTMASPAGNYSCVVNLAPGPQTLTAVATNPGGSASAVTSSFTATGPPTLTVDPPRPGPTTQPITGTATPGTLITITGPGPVTLCSTTATASGSFSCLVTVPVGPTPVTVTACNTAGCATSVVTLTAIGPPTIAVNPLPAISPLSPTVSGTATPGALVNILGPNSTTLCTTTATVAGNYSCVVSLTPGPQTLTAVATNPGGSASATTNSFTATGPPTLTVVQPVTPGPVTQPVVGTATPGSLITITGPGPVTLCTTTASASGTFSCPVSLTSPVTTVTVTACNTAGCTSQPVTLSVAQPPVVTPDIANTNVDTPVSGNVLTNDRDPQGGPLTAQITTPPTVGTVTMAPDGSYTYTPPTGFTGTTSFCYTASNTAGQSNSACVTVNVNPAPSPVTNNQPVANNDNTQTTTGQPVTVAVLANDTEPDSATSANGQLNNPTILSQPAQGTAVVNANGTITYTPPAGFTGVVSFPYQVCDKATPTLCSTALVSVNVQPTPPAGTTLAPTAVDDALLTNRNTPKTGTVAANDTDPAGLPLTYTGGQPTNGTVTMTPNGSYTYTPAPGYVGPDSFTYSVCNSAGKCSIGTTSVNVQAPTNQPPAVTPDFNNVLVGIPATGNVLTNDRDPDGPTSGGQPLTASVIGTPPPGLTLSPNGSYTYTAPVGTTAPVTVPVQVCDNATPPACATTTLTLVPVPPTAPGQNVPPVANPDSPRTTAGIPLTVNVLGNDRDPDGLPLSNPTIVSGPTNGTAVVNPDGTVSYTPTPGFTGKDRLTYQVCDTGTPPACSTAVVTLTVDPTPPAGVTNTAPVAIDDAALTTRNTPVTATVAGNDRDPQGQPLTFTRLSGPANGTVVFSPTGSYTYTPAPGFVGSDALVYQVCDNASPALCSTATAHLTVTNPAPPILIVEPPVPGPTTQPITGTATPGSLVTITGPGPVTLCSTTATQAGTFSCLVTVSPGITTLTVTACNSVSCVSQPVTVTALVGAVSLTVRVMLQGAMPFTGTSTLMRDDLRAGGYLPLTTPYSVAVNPRFGQTGGGGGETTTPAVLSANAIVDWVLVELRNPANPAQIMMTRSGLLQRDGDIVMPTDGTSPLTFTGLVGSQYYVSVKHRNHLGVMTATSLPLSATGTVVDFTTMTNAQVYDKPGTLNYDGVEMITINGKRTLWAGDANADGKVKYIGGASDNGQILNDVITFQGAIANPSYNYDFAFGYFFGDLNLNGKAKYQGSVNDPTVIFDNVVATFPLNLLQLYNYDFMEEQLP